MDVRGKGELSRARRAAARDPGGSAPDRENRDEAAALNPLRRIARVASVLPCDLPHEREAEAGALPRPPAVERLEHPPALRLGHAPPAAANGQLRPLSGPAHAPSGRRR